MEAINIENLSSDDNQGTEKRKAESVKKHTQKKAKTLDPNKKGRSRVWDDFDKLTDDDGEKKAKCKHCLKILAADPSRNGTSALNRNDLGSDGVPTSTDWHYARQLAKSIEKFKQITVRASSSTNVVVNLFFKDIMEIDKHLRDMKVSSDLTNKVTGSQMQHKFEKYWHHDSNMNKLLYFAAILDPRQKLRVIKFGYTILCNSEKKDDKEDINKKVDAILKNVSVAFELLFQEYKAMYETEISNQTSQNEENVQVFSEGDDDFFAKFQSSGGFTSYTNKSELQKYLEDKEEGWYPSFDILQWWKSSSSRYPILSKMAKGDFLVAARCGRSKHRIGADRRRSLMVGDDLIGVELIEGEGGAEVLFGVRETGVELHPSAIWNWKLK
ncbi:hypothetical protein E3N88_25143 [Mikania micrantha]|uniref:BED-type domain-containing protein n=1 Tax=Mikania micrantha TaxID=192012 RepID=A0A5N6N3X3_9ASTR|nr:hypothetical protein E3N88_25143 [Mikania micrantha]